MTNLIGVPHGMKIIKSIVVKRLLNASFAEIFLVLNNEEYEAALFVDDKFRHGPPIPHPLEFPDELNSHMMGARPGIGISPTEAERIFSEVEYENAVLKQKMLDRWKRMTS